MSTQRPSSQGLDEARNLAEDVPEVVPDPPAQVEPQPEQALQVFLSFLLPTLVSFTRAFLSRQFCCPFSEPRTG